MKANKGYSLAELLVSIAIFSVVMLSIVAIMRNVSVSYRNENAEVQLQENSQMVLSQMEELLVDAKSVAYEGSKTWKITDTDDKIHRIKLSGNTVQYNYNGTGYEDLASNVKDLDITGLVSAHGDDKCTVKIEMVNNIDGVDGGHEYTYEASKDIVFRNASVEKSDVHDDSFLSGSGGTPGPAPSPDTISVKMGRYELLNLISEYDIDPSQPISITGDTTAYSFVSTAGLNSSNYMASVTKLATGTTSPYLTTSDTCNSATSTSYSCQVKGKNTSGDTVTLNISTPAVKLLKGNGLVYAPIGAINNGENKNYYSYIEVEGLNVRDAQTYFGVNCTAKLRYSTALAASEMNGTVKSAATDWVNNSSFGTISGPNGGMSCKTGLCYDPFSTDALCVMFSSKLYESPYDPYYAPPDAAGKINTFNSAGYTVKVTLTYPSGSSTASTNETYKVYITSANLQNL